MKKINSGLIFYEGPISRCYLNILDKKKIKLENIYYLSKKTFFPKKINAKYNFFKFNYHPINLLKNPFLKPVFKDILKFFNYDENFFHKMYEFSDHETRSENNYLFKTDDINKDEVVNAITKSSSDLIINTGKKIYKEIFNSKKNFLHIHPAILPDIRGADASLWSALVSDKLGVSSFLMNREIDKGKIINRIQLDLIKLNKILVNKFDVKTSYRFWFSFIDPLIRGLEFDNIINILLKKNKVEPLNQNFINNGEYYSFMSVENKIKVFNKIFSKN